MSCRSRSLTSSQIGYDVSGSVVCRFSDSLGNVGQMGKVARVFESKELGCILTGV